MQQSKGTLGAVLSLIVLVNCLLVVHKYRSSERSPGGGLGGLGSLDDETEVIRPLDPFELQFCREDRERVQDILNLDPSGPRNRMLEYFYKALLRPVQTGCKKIRRVGRGFWDHTQAWDGHKFVCLDDIPSLLQEEGEPCLVYSFGLNHDLTFENAMVETGCEVYAHDHTVNLGKPSNPNLHIFHLGIGATNQEMRHLRTLTTLIKNNGHANRTIHYLKADVEGAEIKVLRDWIDSGVLDQVLQIGLEFHQVPDNIRHFSTLVRDLYGLGFKIIAWDPNLETHLKSGLYEYFEVVFRKTEICLRD